MTIEPVAHAPHPLAGLVLAPGALQFLGDLERQFGGRRRALLQARAERQARLTAGERPNFPGETTDIRRADWRVAEAPAGLVDRRVEITGPTSAKMMINALNSGAAVFMADLEDATSPTWDNVVSGQANLFDAVRRRIEVTTPERTYRLNDTTATLVVRPRGWHLPERHVSIDGEPMSASLFDFGLYVFHNGLEALDRGFGPYLYLPKLEGRLEARLWNDVFSYTERALGLGQGAIRATVLIETVLAAFEMDEILWELRDHVCGLNAGRWDYIFSLAKSFSADPAFVLPDRSQVTMTTPFMRAYTELLVSTCHRRGAHAIGGMAAFIPNRRDPAVTEQALARVAEDKRREAADGFDGTWVAHPDLVATARTEFDAVLGTAPNQLDKRRGDVVVTPSDLLDVRSAPGDITAEGLRRNVSVGLRYLVSWLSGTGAAAIDDLMEDAATAEICRAQVWQWTHHDVRTSDGEPVTAERVRAIIDQTVDDLATAGHAGERLDTARALFEQVALGEPFVTFLTLPAYGLLD